MKKSIIYAFVLGFVGFVTSFGAHVVAVNLPVYAKQVGVGVAIIGLLIAVYDFAEIIAKPVFGAFADKNGMKKTMLAGIALFTIASMAYIWVDPRFLIGIRFLQGLGAAALSAVSLALVGTYYKDNRGQAYGIYNAIKGAGYVISPIIGGALVVKSGFKMIFIVTAGIGIASFLLSLVLPKAEKKADIFDDDEDFTLKSFLSVFRDQRLWRWYIIIVVNMFFVGILFGFLPVYIQTLGYNPFISGLYLSAVSLSYLLIQPLAGWFADKHNAIPTVKLGLIFSALSIIIIPFVNGWPLILVAILAGIGVGTVWTNTDTVVSKLSKDNHLGATMGAAGSFKEFGDMVGPILIGVLSQLFSLRIGFVSCGLLGLLSLFLITANHNVYAQEEARAKK